MFAPFNDFQPLITKKYVMIFAFFFLPKVKSAHMDISASTIIQSVLISHNDLWLMSFERLPNCLR